MIEQIAELNRVLIVANSLSDPVKGLDEIELIKGCKSFSVEARMPDHQETIQFSIKIGLLSRKGRKKVQLTHQGREFLALNPENLFDLSDEQKKFLIRGFFLDGALRKQVRECFKCFATSEEKGTFTWSEVDGTPLGENAWVISHLEQLGLVTQLDEGYIVHLNYVDTISTFINEPKGYTEEQLLKWLEEKKKLGDLAERLALEFEKMRIK